MTNKAYTFSTEGDIIFIKNVNTEGLPNVLNIPGLNTTKRLRTTKPEDTIHKFPKRALS